MKTFTDTDLVVLEDLDFAPPCKPVEDPCDQSAQWSAQMTKKCGCPSARLLCSQHLKTLFASMDDFGNWWCGGCNARFALVAKRDVLTIDRIEAL